MGCTPFALERWFARHEFSARWTLSSSDCDGLAMGKLLAAADAEARALWDDLRLGYTESAGHPLLRREIAATYAGVAPQEVLAFVPEEGIYAAMRCLLRPGDRVVCVAPAYQSLYQVAADLGCEVVRWTPREEDGWRFDPDDLAALAASVAAVHNGEASAVRRISPRAVNLDYFWRVLAGGLAPTTSWLEAVGCLHLAELVHALTTRAAAIVAEARLLWQSATPTPVHGDLRLEHALMQGRRAVLLDWEMFGLGDPALDVATFLRQDAGTMDDASRAHWLACYCDAVRSPELSARIDVYARLLPLQQFAFLLGGLRQLTPSDRHDPDLRNNMAFLRQTLAATGEAAAANLLANPAMPLNEIDHLLMAVAQT
jgi:hypothetical protein